MSAFDAQTSSPGLTTTCGSEVVSLMAASDGFLRLPQFVNAGHELTANMRNLRPNATCYWSV